MGYYFAVIIAFFSLVYALSQKKNGYHYRKNVVISVIVTVISLIFGSYRFLFSDFFDYSDRIVIDVNRKTGLSIPTGEKTVTSKEDKYLLGNVKFSEDWALSEGTLRGVWDVSLTSSVKNVLPYYVSVQVTSFDYFLFYDCDAGAFNEVCHQEDGHSCVFLAYQQSRRRLLILDEYSYKA